MKAGSGTPQDASRTPVQEAKQVPSQQLMTTLGAAGAVAGLLIVVVYRATQPTIQAYKAKMLRQAVEEVLKAPQRYDTLYVYNGSLTPKVPPGTDPRGLEKVYAGYGKNHQPLGFAIPASGPGFQDVIKLIFGYDPSTGKLLGMKVLEDKETPGLGQKIESEERFVSQFDGAVPPLLPVKRSARKATDPRQVETITGATISSRAVVTTINKTLARLKPLIDAYSKEQHR